MKVFIDKRFIPKDRYVELNDRFPMIDFVYHLEEHKDIEVFFGLNQNLREISLDDYPQLKWIQLYMAGFDNIDLDEIKRKNILVSNARDIFSITIAEDIISKISIFNRHTMEYVDQMKKKEWRQISNEHEIWNSVIGICGTGSIGQETAKRLSAFEPKKIIGYRNKNQEVPYFDEIYTGISGLKEVISQSDYLIIALPLNQDTEYLFDKKMLSLMKKEALLINVARGKVIVQEDLISILEKRQIRGAALDVTDPEPLPKDSLLWSLDNCFITAHNASSSMYMKTRLFDLTTDNLERYINDQDLKFLL